MTRVNDAVILETVILRAASKPVNQLIQVFERVIGDTDPSARSFVGYLDVCRQSPLKFLLCRNQMRIPVVFFGAGHSSLTGKKSLDQPLYSPHRKPLCNYLLSYCDLGFRRFQRKQCSGMTQR